MDITSLAFIRSLRNEASRQAEFFDTRSPDLADQWKAVETVAHEAIMNKRPLRLLVVDSQQHTHIIKPCE